jgi:ubiquinone biosynthesis protein
VAWAADLARSLQADLLAIQVVRASETGEEERIKAVTAELTESLPTEGVLAGARVVAADDAAVAIVDEAADAGADMIVIGSSGMRGRKEFLLGNISNRVTHLARCTVVVVNTTMRPPSAAVGGDTVEMRGRVEEIGRVLGPLAARRIAGRVLREEDGEGPRELREGLERLGPTFGKLGQILSTRPDLISPGYLEELANLQADVPPLPESEVVAAMQAELGVPWEDVFASIEPEPLAAGTIGQVHRAELVDGSKVVVKVQRPNAASLVEADLALLEAAMRPVARSTRVRRVIDLPSLVEELSSSLRRELDFGEEAANLERMERLLRPYPRVAVPACHTSLSTPRLLVMDEVVAGVPLTEAPAGPDRTEATRELMQAYYRQVLEEGFFHADPHPGNLLWADGRIWLLDLGMVGRLDAQTRRQLMLVMLAFVEGDLELLVDVALDLSGADTLDLDRAAYRSDLEKIVSKVSGRSLDEIHLVELLNELTSVSVRHGVPLPSSFVMVGKALSQVELTVTELAPEIDPFEEARKFFLSSIRRRIADRIDPQQMVFEVERLRYRIGQISEGLATAVGNRPGRKFEVRFTSQQLERRIVRTGRMVALGLGAGLTWIAATEASASDNVDPRMQKGLRALAGGLSAWFVAEGARRQK